MAQMTIHLLDPEEMIKFYGVRTKEEKINLANELMSQAKYTSTKAIEVQARGELAAEMAFDLTNNPAKSAARAALYGNHRSVSVGDIVEIENEKLLCDSCGWLVVTGNKASSTKMMRP